MGNMGGVQPLRNAIRYLLGDHHKHIASDRVHQSNPPEQMTATEISDALGWGDR